MIKCALPCAVHNGSKTVQAKGRQAILVKWIDLDNVVCEIMMPYSQPALSRN